MTATQEQGSTIETLFNSILGFEEGRGRPWIAQYWKSQNEGTIHRSILTLGWFLEDELPLLHTEQDHDEEKAEKAKKDFLKAAGQALRGRPFYASFNSGIRNILRSGHQKSRLNSVNQIIRGNPNAEQLPSTTILLLKELREFIKESQ